jgi:probable metal-binding protein
MSTSSDAETSVHGHDVIHLIGDAHPPFTRQTLAAEVSRRFGPAVRFHTCSAGGMTLDELLAFLVARGRVVESDGQLRPDMSKVCGNGDHHHDHEH